MEGIVAGLDVDFPCCHEHGPEANALLTEIPGEPRLRIPVDITNRFEILWRKAIVVAVNDYSVLVDFKGD